MRLVRLTLSLGSYFFFLFVNKVFNDHCRCWLKSARGASLYYSAVQYLFRFFYFNDYYFVFNVPIESKSYIFVSYGTVYSYA